MASAMRARCPRRNAADTLSKGRTIIGAICAAFASWFFSAWFGVNGPNYDGWSRTFAVFAGVVVLALLVSLVTRPKVTRVRVSVATTAAIVVVVLVEVTVHWYGDGTPRSDVPPVLAWVGLAALLVAAVAVSVSSRLMAFGRST